MENNSNDNKARKVLELAYSAWVRMGDMRERRRRYVRYTYGDQWSDSVRDRKGRIVSERRLLTAGGREPLTNNLIRRMVKAVVGRYRTLADETSGSACPQQWRELNQLDELDARTLEEFLISGMAVHRVWAERRPSGDGVWVDNIPPDLFFINAVRDCRATDTELIGRVTDMSPGEIVMRFARGNSRRARVLRELYATLDSGSHRLAPDTERAGEESFFHAPQGRCRVVEVWTLECRWMLRCHDPLEATFSVADASQESELKKVNARRRRKGLAAIEWRREGCTVWHCRMLAPDGTVLDEFDSPLAGGCHPFAVKLYPMVDGDVHSLVEDVIDQQRCVNRLITMMDRMMGTAAKGVLLFPTGCKVEGQSWENLAERWSDPGGVIPYRPFQGAEPHQVVTPMSDFGGKELLQTQIDLFEDVSGVSQALMGKPGSAGAGAERFESEVRNSSVAVSDLLKTFDSFTRRRDKLITLFNIDENDSRTTPTLPLQKGGEGEREQHVGRERE